MSQKKDEDSDDDFFPLSGSPNVKSHHEAYKIVEFTPKYGAYMDLTGRFSYN